MVDPFGRRTTYEDLLAVPDHLIAEIVNGVLHTRDRHGALHARAASKLGAKLDGPFDGRWIILDAPEIHLHGDVVVPDLAGWRRTRMPMMPEASSLQLAPDWIGEVLSPGTEAYDRGEKIPIYAREGISHVWLVDPHEKALEAYRLEGGRWLQLGVWSGDACVRVEPFDAHELELAALWAR